MSRYSGLIKLKVRRYLAAAEFAIGEEPQNLNPIRMSKRLADLGDPLIKRTTHLILIHLLMHPSKILHTIIPLSILYRG